MGGDALRFFKPGLAPLQSASRHQIPEVLRRWAANVAPLTLQRHGPLSGRQPRFAMRARDVPTTKVISDRRVGDSGGTGTRGLLCDRRSNRLNYAPHTDESSDSFPLPPMSSPSLPYHPAVRDWATMKCK